MNSMDLARIRDGLRKREARVQIDELENKNDRTLLMGYSYDNKYVHIYIDDESFYEVRYDPFDIYQGNGDNFKRYCWMNSAYILNMINNIHGLFSELCDYEFVKLLLAKGYTLPLLNHCEQRAVLYANSIYYGLLGED